MNTLGLLLEGAWHVLLAGLLLGAGLPAIFALGIRSLSWGAVDASGEAIAHHRPPAVGKAVAALCFGVVLLAVAAGISIIVAHGFGMDVVLGWPVFVPQ